jgi:hypothetical protein
VSYSAFDTHLSEGDDAKAAHKDPAEGSLVQEMDATEKCSGAVTLSKFSVDKGLQPSCVAADALHAQLSKAVDWNEVSLPSLQHLQHWRACIIRGLALSPYLRTIAD